jgi:hypothetical protein
MVRGKNTVGNLSAHIRVRRPRINGCSASNLRRAAPKRILASSLIQIKNPIAHPFRLK